MIILNADTWFSLYYYDLNGRGEKISSAALRTGMQDEEFGHQVQFCVYKSSWTFCI